MSFTYEEMQNAKLKKVLKQAADSIEHCVHCATCGESCRDCVEEGGPCKSKETIKMIKKVLAEAL